MRICILNKSGNVGKTTLKMLLKEALPAYDEISIEDFNKSELDSGTFITGRQFDLLQHELLAKENLLVDVGASNLKLVFAGLEHFEGSAQDFDLYIVPVVPADKQQDEAVATMLYLADLGVDKTAILPFFNQVPIDVDTRASSFLQSIYPRIFIASTLDSFFSIKALWLKQNDFFDQLRIKKITVEEVRAVDPIAAKKNIAHLHGADKSELIDRLTLRRQLSGVVRELEPLVNLIKALDASVSTVIETPKGSRSKGQGND